MIGDEIIVINGEEEGELKETWGDGLEGQARALVESDANRQCVQAGPGTGKSFCMTRRILRLIEQKRVKSDQVLAVTFTRTAATDLRKSLEKVLGEQYRNFRASTLHSLCFNIVESESFLEVRGRHARFLLAVTKSGCLNFEGAPMLADLVYEDQDYGSARVQTRRIKEFEAMWARRQQDPLGTGAEGNDAAYGTGLLNWLKFHKAMLVGELVKEAYEYLSAEPESDWRNKFKAILVDEFQDLNKLDQEMIELLCQADGAIASVVGDYDQSIYSFRCAHPDGLQDYAARDGVEVSTMDTSRRCPTMHLRAAQELIQQNTRKADKYPEPLPDARAGEISVRRWADLSQEVHGVVAYVKYCVAKGVPVGEILVMAPSRLIGREIRKALQSEGVEALSYFAEEQLEVEEAQKAFTLLTLLARPKDRVALRCWLGGWTAGFRAGSYAKLRKYCEENNAEPWDVLEQVVSGQVTLSGISALLNSFNDLRTKLQTYNELKGQNLLDALFPEDAEWASDIRVAAGEGVVAEDVTPGDLCDLLVEAITQPSMPTEVSHVRVMSLHKSKGLTAQASVIAGCVEGLIPRGYDPVKCILTESEHWEEQRRLFYVAMTRSTDYLLICSPRLTEQRFRQQYQLPGRQQGNQWGTAVSRFVTGLAQGMPAAKSTFDFP